MVNQRVSSSWKTSHTDSVHNSLLDVMDVSATVPASDMPGLLTSTSRLTTQKSFFFIQVELVDGQK